MDEKEKREYMREFKEYMEKKASSKESAQDFLVELGVYTKKGNITSHYKSTTCPS